MSQEMFFDEFGDLKFAIGVVGDAVLGHVPDLFLLELEVVKSIL